MHEVPRVALIHATRVAIDPVMGAFQDHWPEAEAVSLLDDALSVDRRKHEKLEAPMFNRISALAHYANTIGSDGILYTCSAFGEAIEKVADSQSIPVLKPNEAMFDNALALGENLVLIYTFEPAVAGMQSEFKINAAEKESKATLEVLFAQGALEALHQGDEAMHNELIAQKVSEVKQADAILLAHFSMARASSACRALTDQPILNSPEAAVKKMRSKILEIPSNLS